MPPEIEARQRAYYHLDRPIAVQFGYYLVQMAKGDLGPSLKYKDKTVNEIIGEGVGPSFFLGSIAMVIALVIGVGAGVVAGLKQNTLWDYGSMTIAMIG